LLQRAFAELSADERGALLEAVGSLLRADDKAAALPPRLPTHLPRFPQKKEP
jgi:hypothetical protein